MEKKIAELVVVGAGPGGYVAAIRGAQLGLKTLVVEDGQVGGVCLNWGCIPSKALIQAAEAFHRLHKELPAMGIEGVENASINPEKLQDWKGKIVAKLTGGIRQLFKGNGIELLEGRATLTGAKAMTVATAQGEVEVEAEKGVILATGSKPFNIPGLEVDGENIINAEQAVNLRTIPKKLAVIGGGVIGLELGTVYRKLGAEVTVVELMPTILPGFDQEVITACGRRLRQLKITVLNEAKAAGIEGSGDDMVLKVEHKGEVKELACDQVLVAVGMAPTTSGLGLEELGVEKDRAFIKVDAHCRTSLPGLYAIGDITGQPMLAHKASFEGEIAAEAVAGHLERDRHAVIPGAVFTDPEIGAVGLTEEQAVAQGHEVKTGKFFFAASGKAIAMQEVQGFAKVVADAKSDKILGVHIIGPHASDLLAEATLAVQRGLTIREMAHVVRAHPTLAEVLAEAVLDVDGMAIHAVKR